MCGAELELLPDGVQRVAAVLLASGHAHAPVMLDAAARTAQQAADARCVAVGQIAKSIVFRRQSDDAAVLVVTSGDRRVDEQKVAALVCLAGSRLGRADAAFVKSRTGFSIGGVPPLAHAAPSDTLIDRSLFRFDDIWAAAGHPHGVFQLSPAQLQDLTGALVVDVAVDVDEKRLDMQHAIGLVRQRAPAQGSAQSMVPEVASPCISVCRMGASSGLCEGCFRTGDEIACWSSASQNGKRALWKLIEQRMHALESQIL